jgi:aspartate/tyrosine/aromatic aminotransferase
MSTELGYRHSALPEADAVKKTGAALKRVNDSNPDLKNTTINATVGVFHRPGATEMPDWYREAYNRATFDGKKTGYDFIGNPEFAKTTKELLFGDDTQNVDVVPGYGGSEAISNGSGVLKAVVPVGVPTWPNHPGIIERAGGVMIPYPHLDNNGEVDSEAFKRLLTPASVTEYIRSSLTEDERLKIISRQLGISPNTIEPGDKNALLGIQKAQLHQKEISPLVEGASKNPLGIGIPKEKYEKYAEALLQNNTVLQVDLAYLGFIDNTEEDLSFVRYMKKAGVKMMVYFSYSKFHQYFGDERVGAVAAVNFSPEEKIKARLLDQTRNTTSAKNEQGQRMAVRIENDEDIRTAQREDVKEIRDNSLINRGHLENSLPEKYKHFAEKGTGPFLFAPDEAPEQPLLPYLHPELAEELGFDVPESARNRPENLSRVAAVPTSPKEGAGLSGVRLSIADAPEETTGKIAAALKHAYKQTS